jgi:uncharacterized protein involved in outer membrane biogenesis
VAEELKDTLLSNAQGPAEATGDEGSVKQHNLKDQIEADRYLRNVASAGGSKFPIRMAKVRANSANGRLSGNC